MPMLIDHEPFAPARPDQLPGRTRNSVLRVDRAW
jgi:hypothetical protein